MLGALTDAAWSRRAIFQERSISLHDLVVAMAEHDEAHLHALTAELGEQAAPEESYAAVAPAAVAVAGAAVSR